MTERRSPIDRRTPSRGIGPQTPPGGIPPSGKKAAEVTRRRARRSSSSSSTTMNQVARFAGLAGLTAIATLTVVQANAWLHTSQALAVRTVVVRGVEDPRAEEIRALAGIEPGAPLFGVDLPRVVAAVREHPYVRSVSVRRVPPDRIELVVDERRAVAVLSTPALYLVDDEGVVFKRVLPGDDVDLPVITGLDAAAIDAPSIDAVAGAVPGAPHDDVRRALALLDEHGRTGQPGGVISEVAIRPLVGLDVVFTDGMRVRIGRDAIREKIGRLATVLTRLRAQQARASFIYLDDARNPKRVAVRLRPAPDTAAARSSGT